MREVEIPIPANIQSNSVTEVIERIYTTEALTITLKSTLRQYPGCIHWHLKKGRERGVLEITWWEEGKRLWFKVSAGRTGDWIDEVIINMQTQIRSSFLSQTDER